MYGKNYNSVQKELESRIEEVKSLLDFKFQEYPDYLSPTSFSRNKIYEDPDFYSLVEYIEENYITETEKEEFNKYAQYMDIYGDWDKKEDCYLHYLATDFKNGNVECFSFYPLDFVKLLDAPSQLRAVVGYLGINKHVLYRCPRCDEHNKYDGYSTGGKVREIYYNYFLNYSCPKCRNFWDDELYKLETDLEKLKSGGRIQGNSIIIPKSYATGCEYKGKNTKIKINPTKVHTSLEITVLDFIRTFYNGPFIIGNRSILKGLELDLYFPEKNIAIEVNGDYWHKTSSEDKHTKPKDYHTNKFLLCKERNVLLVNIFYSDWRKRQVDIKLYLRDLFNGVPNSLSFVDEKIDLNYPPLDILKYDIKLENVEENKHFFGNDPVYNCGFFTIKEENHGKQF